LVNPQALAKGDKLTKPALIFRRQKLLNSLLRQHLTAPGGDSGNNMAL
jgi:hypothetical protein